MAELVPQLNNVGMSKLITIIAVIAIAGSAAAREPKIAYQGMIERGVMSQQMVSVKTLRLEEAARMRYSEFRNPSPRCAPSRSQPEPRGQSLNADARGRKP